MVQRNAYALAIMPIALITVIISISCKDADQTFHPDIDSEIVRLAGLSDREVPGFIQNLDRSDVIAEYYRDPATRREVLDFFTGLTHSEKIAAAILENADRFGVPPGLAFALAYEESKFKVAAINDNGDSVDRGLFQLNSKSFPELTEAQVYDPRENARYGLAHLEFCLRTGGNEVAALAMYNAGTTRVSRDGTPRRTLNYVFRITKYEENITSLFAAKVIAKDKLRVARGDRLAPAAD